MMWLCVAEQGFRLPGVALEALAEFLLHLTCLQASHGVKPHQDLVCTFQEQAVMVPAGGFFPQRNKAGRN